MSLPIKKKKRKKRSAGIGKPPAKGIEIPKKLTKKEKDVLEDPEYKKIYEERVQWHRERNVSHKKNMEEYWDIIRKHKPEEIQTSKTITRYTDYPEQETITVQIPYEVTINAGKDSSDRLLSGTYNQMDFEKIDSPMNSQWNRFEMLSSYGYKWGRPFLVEMTPDEFLGYSTQLRPEVTSGLSMLGIRAGIKDGNFFDTPRIDLNEYGYAKASAHEGRHRALVLKELGIKKMPVVVYDGRFKEKNWKHYEPDWVIKATEELQAIRDERRMRRYKK